MRMYVFYAKRREKKENISCCKPKKNQKAKMIVSVCPPICFFVWCCCAGADTFLLCNAGRYRDQHRLPQLWVNDVCWRPIDKIRSGVSLFNLRIESPGPSGADPTTNEKNTPTPIIRPTTTYNKKQTMAAGLYVFSFQIRDCLFTTCRLTLSYFRWDVLSLLIVRSNRHYLSPPRSKMLNGLCDG